MKRAEIKKLLKADLDFYGCISITLTRSLVKKHGYTFSAIAQTVEEIKKEVV